MKRQMNACTAVFALLAVAVMPQIVNAQSKPQNVTVVNPTTNPVNARITNSVVPVEVSNADPIPVDVTGLGTDWNHYEPMTLRTFHNGSGFANGFGDFTSDAVISSLVVVAFLEDPVETTFARCNVSASIGGRTVSFFHVLPGHQVVAPIPLPNVQVPAGTQFGVHVNNSFSGPLCEAVVHVQARLLF